MIETERLRLRPFERTDAPDVERLCGDRRVAATTLHIPHPYPEGAARGWIDTHQGVFERGEGVTFAVERRDDGALVGAISLRVDRDHARAELGYWVGVPYWNNGYATEAARATVDHGFRELDVDRVFAYHFSVNAASGRVLEKIGMRHEGRLRKHHRKWGEPLDSDLYGVLREEWAPA